MSTLKDLNKLDKQIIVYFSVEQKEKLIEIMLKESYDISLSTFLRKVILEYFKIK